MPAGILVGALTGGLIGVLGDSDDPATAWGELSGVVIGTLAGLVAGWIRLGHFEFDFEEVDISNCSDWRLLRNLHVATAWHHYLLVYHEGTRKDGAYLVYEPTLAPPITGGPVTVSSEYLKLLVHLTRGKATMIGPNWLVEFLAANLLKLQISAELAPAEPETTFGPLDSFQGWIDAVKVPFWR